MPGNSRELWAAFAAIAVITAGYALVMRSLGGIPPAAGLFGHGLGIVGFLLMLLTETLYSLRKRSRSARWGQMTTWLQFHIFTGLVGPYMVLLHASWQFKGLAGVVMLLTVVIVISGVIGRYIYTAVPRTADGIEIESSQLEAELEAVEAQLRAWLAQQPENARAWAQRLATEGSAAAGNSVGMLFGRGFTENTRRLQLWWEKQRMPRAVRSQATQFDRLVIRRRVLQRQLGSLAVARRTLGVWHTIHVPIGMALFTAAFAHVAAVLYFAMGLR